MRLAVSATPGRRRHRVRRRRWRTSVSRASQRRANARSEYFAEAVGLLIVEIRKREQRVMSARLGSPSRDSRNSAGVLTIRALRVMIAEVRPLRAVSLATLTWRIISTSPSAVLGIAVEVRARTDRAAASASIASDLPLLRRDRRSPRSRLNDPMPAPSQVAGEPHSIAAGSLNSEPVNPAQVLRPCHQAGRSRRCQRSPCGLPGGCRAG